MELMKHERPEVGSVVKVWINNQGPEVFEIAGYFEKTRSVFLYEDHFTPVVVEWDNIVWEYLNEALLREMEEDIDSWQNYENGSLQEYLIEKGWRKE